MKKYKYYTCGKRNKEYMYTVSETTCYTFWQASLRELDESYQGLDDVSVNKDDIMIALNQETQIDQVKKYIHII